MAQRVESGLSEQQERFCNEYLIDLNGTQAAIRAGYSEQTAHVQASRMLTKVKIAERLNQLRAELAKSKRITPERVVEEFQKLALFDVRKLYHGDGTPKAITDLDDDTAAAIVGLDSVMVGNADLGVGQVLKYKLASKQSALESLAKIFGMHAADRVEHSGPNGGPIEVVDPAETARRVAFTFLQVEAKTPHNGEELP